MAAPGRLRIIGGRWRRRILQIPGGPELRPTPDRVRETLFNWLAPVIEGARCLDCYAGTGALGFEALSRGAASVVMLERDKALADALKQQAAALGADGAEIHCVNAGRWLDLHGGRFNVVFVDPPFASDLAARTCVQVLNKGHLSPCGVIYVETRHGWSPPDDRFEVKKEGRAGQVQYLLLARVGGGNERQGDLSGDV